MGDLKQNQENLRQQLQRMLEALKRQRERGDQTEEERTARARKPATP